MIKSIPLNKLVQSPRNVRRHSDPASDAELRASIAAHGLLQNLIVRPAAKGKFEVEAGERRRRAMLALADEKIFARDHEVTCLVLEDSAEAAVETSLAENFHRLAMLGQVSKTVLFVVMRGRPTAALTQRAGGGRPAPRIAQRCLIAA